MPNTETAQKFLSQLQEVLKVPVEERPKTLFNIKADLAAEAEGAGPTKMFKWDE
jgi:hypothetical protein